ncbi:hypothetical protein AXX12_09130 [Anaerosporomusa subterranea]|uniref:Uncharacterized protein n=1 Tax=Anaerosporomusa subterranea TaxID=1794912 RepID=A0A154BRK1_ANASB|nr:hypothetical protein [Anaerosporomusa subterranea]KYZ76582.1 hypothetical protein AXX12_09130 [Anaerosporomusa subterranea]
MLEMRLGIAGTAKNTGKTTTTAAVIDELRRRGIPFYLTSIGYDGENIDNVTGLPKPKLRVEAGDIIATAEKCIKASTAVFSILQETSVRTPLGRILVARVEKAGLAVTAGPNKSTEVGEVAQILSRIGPGITLFDGALNRIAPMIETDGFILATGASRTPDIPRLAKETERIWRIANLPTVPRAFELTERRPETVTLFDSDLEVLAHWTGGSLLSEEDAASAVKAASSGGAYLYIPGIIGERAFAYLAERAAELPKQMFLTLADPIKLLAFANPVAHYDWIVKLKRHGVLTGVLKRVPLLAVTLNPFFPEFRFDTESYRPAFVDPIRLQVAVSKQVQAPVYNVVKQGIKGLVDNILSQARLWEHPTTTRF